MEILSPNARRDSDSVFDKLFQCDAANRLRVAEEELKLPPKVSRFVLTLGATANQNGTALYEGIVVLFLAQFFGIELSIGQQATVVFAAVVAGIGTAGVPGGSLPVIVLILQSVGVPGEGIGIILGVDRILDMSRTVINVTEI
ncbi:MAG: cation:dicarboxylase symporter family transporter [bacterium]|nr:cation:dicarboxylase symporter family transporter [bacterium]